MSRSNQQAIAEIQVLCNELLTRLEEQNIAADNVFLNEKMAILRNILQIHRTADVSYYLNSPLKPTSDETNAAFFNQSNAQFLVQAKILSVRLKDQIKTATTDLFQNPRFWLLLVASWYFAAILNSIIYAALAFFGIWCLSEIATLSRKATDAHIACTQFMTTINGIIADTEAEEVSASLQTRSVDNTALPNAETLSEAVLRTPGYMGEDLDEQLNTPLHILLASKLSQQTNVNIGRMKAAVETLQRYKYHRNQHNVTPLLAISQGDPYQLRSLFKLDHMLSIGSSFNKIDAFLGVFRAKPKETERFLLLEGPSGTGKSATVLQYLGVQKNCVIQEWVQGAEGDQWRGQLEARITQTFQTLIASAKKDLGRTYILYLDKIEAISPHAPNSGDQPSSKASSYAGVAEQFQRNLESLRKNTNNVLVIGTTTSALSLSSSMRTFGTRVLFALPKYPERVALLRHFFIEKQISESQIQRTAQLTDGWSPQSLVSLVNEIVEIEVSDQAIYRAYDRCAAIIENDFKQVYSSAELQLPRWTTVTDEADYQIVTPRCIEDCFAQLKDYLHNPQYYTKTPMHVLLSGPPGGGKTTAVRNFSLQSKVVFILVKSGIMEFELTRLLERANQFDQALIFIDEVDQCSCLDVLQTQMDGFKTNNSIIIAATNHPEKIHLTRAALWSRFIFKIEVPALDAEQRGQYISWIIHRELRLAPRVSIDSALEQDLTQNCPALTSACNTWDMRSIGWKLQTFFGQRRSAFGRNLSQDAVTLDDTTNVFALR